MTTENRPLSPEAPANADERARKRAAIGLAATRPTAKSNVQRPPGMGTPSGWLWMIVLPVVAMIIVTLLLVAARMIASPLTLSQTEMWLGNWLGREAPAADAAAYGLLIADDFSQPDSVLTATEQSGEWTMAVQPDRGVYHLQIQPGRLGWSTVGAHSLSPFYAKALVTISAATPTAFTGLLARRQDDANFYLFAINGKGEYQVQLWQDGETQALTPWLPDSAVQPAGLANQVAVVDDGTGLRFFVNNILFFQEDTPRLPAGDVGVFGAAPSESNAEVDVDSLQIYTLPAS